MIKQIEIYGQRLKLRSVDKERTGSSSPQSIVACGQWKQMLCYDLQKRFERIDDSQAASSALSFAATYAIGQMAQNYYAGGRTLSNLDMRSLFGKFKTDVCDVRGVHTADARRLAERCRRNAR